MHKEEWNSYYYSTDSQETISHSGRDSDDNYSLPRSYNANTDASPPANIYQNQY